MSARRQLGLALASLILFVAGCGGGRGTVSGKVEFGGKTVKSGTVTFFGSDGIPYASPIDSSGNYKVKDVPAGKAKIAVISPDPRDDKDREGKVTAAPEVVKAWFAIPPQFGDSNKSGLTFEVRGGDNSHDIQLK